MQARFWWPHIFRDCKAYVKRRDTCQWMGKPVPRDNMALQPIIPLKPFEKWGIDFVCPISPPTKGMRNEYTLVVVDYVTKWVEAIAFRTNDAKNVATFLYENIIVRFGCPIELVSDRGTHFVNEVVECLIDTYKIKHRKTTSYHPQSNG